MFRKDKLGRVVSLDLAPLERQCVRVSANLISDSYPQASSNADIHFAMLLYALVVLSLAWSCLAQDVTVMMNDSRVIYTHNGADEE